MKKSAPRSVHSLSNVQSKHEAKSGPDVPQRLRFSAEIPGGARGPLWKLHVEALSEPAPGGGERLRLRAHVQTNLASVVKPALSDFGARLQARLPAPAREAGTALAPVAREAARWLGGWVEQRAQRLAPRLGQWAAPLLQHDLQSWVELHASTAPLVEGAQALLPNAAQLSQLGINPHTGPNAPAVQAWQGRIGDEAAQVSLLRVDDRQLPPALREKLGGTPLQIAAAVVNVVARKP
jgi:hypothetical protein